MPKKNVSRYVLLGLLDWRPMSGYDIKKIVEFSIRDFWSESYGNIYPTLQKFLADGFAEKTVERQEGKPDRIVYHITPSGRKELIEWLNESYKQRRIRDEFLVKFLFGHLLPVESNIHLVETFRHSLAERMEWYRESVASLKKKGLKDRKDLLEYLALLQGIFVRESKLRWCEEALSALKEHQND
jgi:DNA-binding PadR family transcriptional regulator